MKQLEIITTCFDYSDFLRETAPFVLPHADSWTVATSPDDEGTREVCRRFGIRVLLTEEHRRDGESFNKGRVVRRLFDQVSAADWVLHLDADIALPAHFRHALRDWCHLHEETVYGFDRLCVVGWDQWQQVKASGYLQAGGQFDYHCRINFAAGLQVGTRWASREFGWVPIGFAQLVHGSALTHRGIHVRSYPTHHGDAARSDVQFGLAFDRRRRALVPEVVVMHLDSEPSPLGANWKGRITRRFGPSGTSEAAPNTY
jgi:hypothetical protein